MKKPLGTALITGASSGIGAVYADRLARRGHRLILVARRRERLQALAARLQQAYGIDVEVCPADLASDEDVSRIVERLASDHAIEMIVNGAGVGALGPAAAVEPVAVADVIKINVLALTQLSLAAARAFAQRGRGTIINIGSIVGVMPLPGASSYSASKAYVLSFTRSLQAELGAQGVTVQVVMPGLVRTEFFGGKPTPFPAHLFMSADTLVDAALDALDRGELIAFPSLHDEAAWHGFEEARSQLAQALLQHGEPAARYASGALAQA